MTSTSKKHEIEAVSTADLNGVLRMSNVVEKVRPNTVHIQTGESSRMQSRFKYLGINPWMVVAFALGLAVAWRSRFYMTHDGVAYLDMGDAYLRGDWHTAINGYFNPLYAWIQMLARVVLHPSMYWEYPVAHLVHYGIFVVSVFAFEYFLRGLLGAREDVFAIRCIAYSIFLWSSLQLTSLTVIEPDMIVSACVYAALGMLMRGPKINPVALGAALAIGYYTKAWMFPLALIILIAAWKLLPRRSALIAATTFLLLCVPLIVALSVSSGHVTIGDTSRLNYAWYVNNVDMGRFWQGGPPKAGQPIHPARIALDSPRVYEFGGVFPVTFAIWYDQSYWYRGLHLWFAPRLLAHAYFKNALGVAKLLICQGGGFLIGWILCLLLQKDKTLRKGTAPGWIAWLVGLAALLFLCAAHVETRYIASIVTTLFLIPFTSLSGRIGKILGGAVAIGGLVWAVSFSSVTTWRGEEMHPLLPFQTTPQNDSWQVATDMQRLGIQPSDELAIAGHSNPIVFAARLMRARIIAQLDWSVSFWQLSEPDRQRVLAALASRGAKYAISEVAPPDPSQAVGWQRIGSSRYYAYPLSGLAGPSKTNLESVYR
jgi:hypothetical protein